MQVGIVESGHHEMSAKIDHLRLRSLQLFNVESLSDRLDAVAANRNGFFAKDGTESAVGRHSRIDIAVDEYDVGLRLGVGRWCGVLTHAGRDANDATKDCTKACLHGQIHSPTPASASMVSRIRFNASSRPLQSNHSCKVCAPPPEPPPPIATASRPRDKGIFASVDARCTCAAFPNCASTARRTCKIRAPGLNSPAGRLPITTTSQFTPDGLFCAGERISAAMVSSSTARFRAKRSECSNRSISVMDVDRISTFMLA